MATRYPVKIKAAPKVGSLYWCALHPENMIHIPEFWKKRPVVVISRKNMLHGKVIVLPITTDDDNQSYENSVELSKATSDKINGRRCWVVCDHPMTVATSRLDFVNRNPPRIAMDELSPILEKCHASMAGWAQKPNPEILIKETSTFTDTSGRTIITDEVVIEIDLPTQK
ncbi:type II toxin-antitoxin system PemK/MazF family toxin [Neorhizobium sp. JUb45]|uniref:type II toxin-antitoxin system PemK/MazF family toxin n=1 Tax=unclassified Neorhizobium TaxID=2629175 RepID=UPI00104C8C92|nr:type II toxin-antitoxin system PemK/MazF family toxin [Neorhizobium sp. JUb45]TCR04084.1 mRNA interferase MazF [Neorhizobium sp. JUb45]